MSAGEFVRALPPEQEAIRAKCFHPSGSFVEFPMEDVETSIPARFEKMVQLYSGCIAIVAKEGGVTYDELNRAANRVGRAILARRDQGQAPIGLFFEHGAWPIIAYLGVLKAGGTAVQLHPAHSAARVSALIEASQAQIILTDEHNIAVARQLSGDKAQVLNVDEIGSDCRSDNLQLPLGAHHYACIRYTSGSTAGRKGVVKTHRAILHAVMNLTNDYHVCPSDRILLLTRDTLGKHVFEALLNGAAVCPYDVLADGLSGIAQRMAREQITICKFFPTAFRSFTANLTHGAELASLRLIRLEGESVYVQDVERYRKLFPAHCLLVNSYAATEAGVISIYFMDHQSNIRNGIVPVGYPSFGKEVTIVGENGEAMGTGQCGEIVVSSSFFPEGYWQQSAGADRQRHSHASPAEPKRYYTGDWGQLSADGCLEHLGRRDAQVKIRGYRVDVGEVESVLATHPEVSAAAVVARIQARDEMQLIGYIVPKPSFAPSVGSLRRHLLTQLPEYMVPAMFTTLPSLPQTVMGKLDRRALPSPARQRPNLERAWVAPRTATERELSQIWAEVLGLDQIGVDDNFFELGGHSLAAMRVVARVIQHFQLDLPVKEVFDAPTVAEIAAMIAAHQTHVADGQALARLLSEVEAMTEEQALKLLEPA